MKNQPFARRLGFAIAGLRAAWRGEASFRIQVAAAVAVVAALVLLRPPAVWWALLLLTTGAVLSAEVMNTALEHLVDHLHPERHPSIELAKDCAAGAVLVLSATSVAVFVAMLFALWG